ncbi:hypothetical protein SAMN05216570_2615 [Dyella sp. OK004]|uniref:hypothetical protein n=1 Tax=Dyella sp. OK004 TaxID=1855292 RepID=UPI0008E63382|nr:hypothetical protein [Dyella sp. OK004]SFS12118.1 hypothetical protein SAMN05216570_2615 [Dyella sp. OK004]
MRLAKVWVNGNRVAAQLAEGYVLGEIAGPCPVESGSSLYGVDRKRGEQTWRNKDGAQLSVRVESVDVEASGAWHWLEDDG